MLWYGEFKSTSLSCRRSSCSSLQTHLQSQCTTKYISAISDSLVQDYSVDQVRVRTGAGSA